MTHAPGAGIFHPMSYQRQIVADLAGCVRKGPPLLQVVAGPRQVGKSTAAANLQRLLGWPSVFEAADHSPPAGPEWIETHWTRARALTGKHKLLILDEVQKVRGWSETVKRLWDEDRRKGNGPAVLLLGSSALLLQRGLSESLAGRFLLHRCMHWSFSECAAAFGWDLDRYLYFGGYPGAAALAGDEALWARYITDSLIETAIARDVLQMQTVNKPALLRELFGVAAAHPAQVFSYNKMLGQLTDAGNTTTLAHYLSLLETAFLLSGLPLYSPGHARQRAASPKLVVWNNALVNAPSRRGFRPARADTAWWGRLVENAVGASLLNGLPRETFSLAYWRQGDDEVDFVVSAGRKVWALEVKSGRPGPRRGMEAFRARFPAAKALIIGSGGIPMEEFFSSPPDHWFPG